MTTPPLTSRQRWLLVVIAGLWLAACSASLFGVPRLIDTAYAGESIDFLNRKFEGHRRFREAKGLDASAEWYAAWGRSYSVKAVGLATLAAAAAAVLIVFRSPRWRVKRFLFASSAPLNLAVLRVAVFGMLFYLLATEPILKYAAWPQDLYQWPAVGGVVLSKLPMSVEVAQPTLIVGFVATAMAFFGLFTRASALASVALAFYLLGIPQCSGKVDHMHHLLLIGLVVGLSRCGDALSIDAIWQAMRSADRGEVQAPRPAVRYGLPIRLSMAILAIVYFFPGFWKIASNGPVWIFSDNLNNQLLRKWFQLEYYTPPLPIHQLPMASQMGALTAVLFEVGFPLAILWSRTRAVWAALGLFFHNLTRILMNIAFVTLQAMYVMFVDWQSLLAWLGRRLFGEPMLLLYDGNCKLCRRAVAVLATHDLLQTIRPVSAFDRAEIDRLGLGHLGDEDLMTDMHAAWRDGTGQWRTARGYAAYQRLAWRTPKLWLAAPLMMLPPVAAIGRRVYRRVADSRACSVVDKPDVGSGGYRRPRWSAGPVLLAASVILLPMGVLGVGRVRMAWPVSCYPLFDQLEKPEIYWPQFFAIASDGSRVELDDDPLRDQLGDSRYFETLGRFIEKPVDEEKLASLLAEMAVYWRGAGELAAEPPASIAVYSSRYELVGPGRPEAPASTELLADVPWATIEAAPREP